MHATKFITRQVTQLLQERKVEQAKQLLQKLELDAQQLALLYSPADGLELRRLVLWHTKTVQQLKEEIYATCN
jgi:hypothetical protein